jgi:pantoate--beta-alanine ligase
VAVETFITIDEIQGFVAGHRRAGRTVAFVPTMGALHAGHAKLVEVARQHADVTVVSIFVNPLQFGPNEDFARYPRTLNADLEILSEQDADGVFVPNIQDMYPESSQTRIYNDRIANDLCGRFRPGHFEGVLTVVMKLFGIVSPDTAVFGKKDYQQLKLISLMVNDFHMPLKIVGVDTLRDSDGLAMSSRNRYLKTEERQHAISIPSALKAALSAFSAGERSPQKLEEIAFNSLSPELKVEYVAVRKQRDLSAFSDGIDQNAVILLAAKLGGTRLIDNMELNLRG